MEQILITGSRTNNDFQTMKREWHKFKAQNGLTNETTTIIHGGAAGTDTLASRLAKEEGIKQEEHRADWHTFGKSAGPRRNAEMTHKATKVLAFWDGESPGTANTIKQAKRKGKPTTIIYTKEQKAEQLTLF